ncbi:MAG: polyprenyl diphosphate synthase [Methanocorpusculum sp.]|nr:polyprenyl diphosphate synthase [Methanocorpusculum sp.]
MSIRTFAEDVYAHKVLRGLKHKPTHVAIIMDGNRRYAKSHGLGVDQGHNIGADQTIRVIDWMGEIGIKHMTYYAFSTENFKRSDEEVADLMELFINRFTNLLTDERIFAKEINISIIGDRSLIPARLIKSIENLENVTKDHNKYYIHFALAYGGRNEIVETAKRIVSGVRSGEISADSITPECVTKNMYPNKPMPPVDLIIRTGNDKRTSNFLPWLANGNEAAVFFCAPTWPEFRYVDMIRALRVYDERVDNQQTCS